MADSKSEKALEAAAESGDSQAMYELGLILEHRGELNASAKWMSMASESGLAKATFHVARFLFENGRESLSEEWFEKAIQQGSQDARDYERNPATRVADPEETTYAELSADQRQVMQAFAAELSDVVTTYGVSPLGTEEEDLSEEDIQNNRVWSVVSFVASGTMRLDGVEDGAYRTDAMLTPRYLEGAISYHLAKTAYSEDEPLDSNPYTSLIFNCTACDSEGCEECYEDGELLFSAVWDDKDAAFWRD